MRHNEERRVVSSGKSNVSLSWFFAKFPFQVNQQTTVLNLGCYQALHQRSWLFDLSAMPYSERIHEDVQTAVYMHEIFSHPNVLRKYKAFIFGLDENTYGHISFWANASKWILNETRPLIEVFPALEWAFLNEMKNQHYADNILLALLSSSLNEIQVQEIGNGLVKLSKMLLPQVDIDRDEAPQEFIQFCYLMLELLTHYNCNIKDQNEFTLDNPILIIENLLTELEPLLNNVDKSRVRVIDALRVIHAALWKLGYRPLFTCNSMALYIDIPMMMEWNEVLGLRNMIADFGLGFDIYVVDPKKIRLNFNITQLDFLPTMSPLLNLSKMQKRLCSNLKRKALLKKTDIRMPLFGLPVVKVTDPFSALSIFVNEMKSIAQYITNRYKEFLKTERGKQLKKMNTCDIKTWEKGWITIPREKDQQFHPVNYFPLDFLNVGCFLENFDEECFEQKALDTLASLIEEDDCMTHYDAMMPSIKKQAERLNEYIE